MADERGNVNVGPLLRLAKVVAAHTGETVEAVVRRLLAKPLERDHARVVREQAAALTGGK